MFVKRLLGPVSLAVLIASIAAQQASAQVPENIYQSLLKIGQIVDPACTAKLYRPLMPANDYNTYWAPGAAAPDPAKLQLYPGMTLSREVRFGPHERDLLDIYVPDAGGNNLPVFMWVPGGGGVKIEQQIREANAFYDNVGRWGAKNGYVTVIVPRHGGPNWDDPARDIAAAVDWVKANIGKYRGNGDNIAMGAHSNASNPTGIYVGHPERWPNGVNIKAIVYLSGNGGPIPTIIGPQPAAMGGGGGVPLPNPATTQAGSSCGAPLGVQANEGLISGPMALPPRPAGGPGAPAAGGAAPGAAPTAPGAAAPPAPAPAAGGGGGGGPPQLTPEQIAERDNLPGFLKTNVRIMLVRAELDPGVTGDMTPVDKAIRDRLCASVGPNARGGEGRCPVTLFARRHSHMSQIFAFDTADESVSKPILDFFRSAGVR